jgi:hypothetical protein
MIDYIKPDPEGFIVVHCFQDKKSVRSDLKYLKSLRHAYKDVSIPPPIKSIQRNHPIYINDKIIFLAVPNRQAPFRTYINVIEIQKMRLNDNTLELRFYSGNHLAIQLNNPAIYKKAGQLLKIIDQGF